MSFPALNILLKAIRIALGSSEPSPDYVAYWTGDNISGTTEFDETTNNLDGTVGSDVGIVAGKIGDALDFSLDTGSAVVNVPHDNLLAPSTNELTYVFWMKAPTATSSNDEAVMFSKYNPGTDSGHQVEVSKASGLVSLVIGNGTTSPKVTSTTVVDDDTWYFVCLTYKSGIGKVYIDGQLETTNVSMGAIVTTADQFRTGTADYSGGSHRYNSLLDDRKFYNRELTATEILDLYNQFTHTVTINPNKVLKLINPSAPYYSPLINAIVTNGIGPFTYSWAYKTGDNVLAIVGPTNLSSMQVQGQSFTQETNDTFEVTVTDTGNGDLTATATINFLINWDTV